MTFLKKSFKLGNITLPSNIFYAPLAGCSDYPYRKMSSFYQPGLQYCEMVKMDAIVRHDKGTFQMLDYDVDMHPIGAQLCGSKPQMAKQAARIIEDRGFDVLDLNCGCPVDKVTQDGSGSGLLKNPELIGEIISNMVSAVKIPVTVKIRAGWDEASIVAPIITEIAEKAGAVGICIHGRTRAQGYKGPAKWNWIRECRERAKNIKIIGNGDLFSPEAVENMFLETGCDAVLIARGTMGQPWIAEDVYRHFEGLPPLERSMQFRREALKKHFEITLKYQNDRRTLLDMRRVGCWYVKKASGTKGFREKVSHSQSIEEMRDLILNYPLGEWIDTPDVEEAACDC